MFASLLFPLFAEAVPAEAQQGSSSMFFFLMLPVVLIFMWFLLMNPQKKQEERMRKMLESLDKNDKVMTVGGVIATVHSVDREHNEIVLKVDDAGNVKMRFHLTAVNTVFPKEKEKDTKSQH
ncbi:MAG: preprotein translocase subunit YajC [Planctomycetaceae bacterium]|jgi:preprotein translocase subunit YajC|nr:preprotein translocase subunit YajC [Planctomycetaceae bacterium]